MSLSHVARGRKLRAALGYTMVEILASAAIATTASLGLVALQTASLEGATASRDQADALNLAEHLLSTVQAEATTWTQTRDTTTTKTYLVNLPVPAIVGQTTGWLAAYKQTSGTDKRVGQMGGDNLGAASFDIGILNELPKDLGRRFCVQYRLTWLRDDLVRAEVRVLWMAKWASDKASSSNKYLECAMGLANEVGRVNMVTMTTAVMKNVFVP